MWLRQSTASQEISLGQFLDSTDGNTEENGLTIANTDIKIRKGGTTTLANKNSGGATNISNGVYHATLDATDTDTLGLLEIYVHVAGALATKTNYMVLPAASYDALVTNGLNNFDASSDVVANVTLVATTTVNTDMVGTDNAATATDLATVDSNVDAILVDTSTTIPAQITALNDFNPTSDTVANVTLVATTTTNTDMRGTDGANTITPPTTAQIWAEATRTLTAGTNIVLAKGVGVTGFNDLSFNDVWTGALTESYAVDGAAITPAQGIHMIWSDLRSPQQVSTTWSDFRLDNTTVAMTFTLDNATTPTKKTRAS